MAGSYPTVEMMGDHIYRVRDCCFVIDTFQFVQDYSPDVRAKWWEAYKYLRELMEDPKRSVQVMIVLRMTCFFYNKLDQNFYLSCQERFKLKSEFLNANDN